MEIEKSPSEIAKKFWSIVRTAFYMMRKSLSKSKLVLHLHMLLKRGKVASKAIGNLMLTHNHNYYSTLTCRSNDVNKSFLSPQEYEFSCSNSPVYSSYLSKRKNHHLHRRRQGHYQEEELNVVQNMLDVWNHYDAIEASPLPGFGCSPKVRQLRVTDSPFPLKDTEEHHQVDKDAEEFIKKFYKDLKDQKRIAALESPSPYHMRTR
ncbi:hypothetical protein Pfo_000388 [Paulownia fortunei]|nr:hypothetical protein Pfo_000388 [Paulownia fortunei]